MLLQTPHVSTTHSHGCSHSIRGPGPQGHKPEPVPNPVPVRVLYCFRYCIQSEYGPNLRLVLHLLQTLDTNRYQRWYQALTGARHGAGRELVPG